MQVRDHRELTQSFLRDTFFYEVSYFFLNKKLNYHHYDQDNDQFETNIDSPAQGYLREGKYLGKLDLLLQKTLSTENGTYSTKSFC